jgi:hypothetical protein
MLFSYPATPLQGPASRVTYRADNGHIWDLAYVPSVGWSSTDVTGRTGAAACPAPGPQTYGTEFPDLQDRFLRVVYRAANSHIWELAYNPAGPWLPTDLTDQAGGAPAQYPPVVYVTDLLGQGRFAWVVYRAVDGHVWELAYNPSVGWSPADLTAQAGGGLTTDPRGRATAEVTDLPGEGHVARVTYRADDGHIRQLAYVPSTGWSSTDVTVVSRSALAHRGLTTFTSEFAGIRVARLVYLTSDDQVWELYYHPSAGWDHNNLTGITSSGPALGDPMAYLTDFSSQQTTTSGWSIKVTTVMFWELAYVPSAGWSSADLTTL